MNNDHKLNCPLSTQYQGGWSATAPPACSCHISTHSNLSSQTVKKVPEPWVREFDDLMLVRFVSDTITLDYYGVQKIKAFIQKTLEADRKERAGVVLERVENMRVTAPNLYPTNRMEIEGRNKAIDEVVFIIKDVMK